MTTRIQGVVLDAVTNDTIQNGFIELLSTGEVVRLDSSAGVYSFNYYETDTSFTPVAHIEALPYYQHDEQLSFVLDTVVTHNIYLQRVPQSSISGTVRDSITQQPIQSTVTVFATTPGGSVTYLDSTDATGTFLLDSLFVSYPQLSPTTN